MYRKIKLLIGIFNFSSSQKSLIRFSLGEFNKGMKNNNQGHVIFNVDFGVRQLFQYFLLSKYFQEKGYSVKFHRKLYINRTTVIGNLKSFIIQFIHYGPRLIQKVINAQPLKFIKLKTIKSSFIEARDIFEGLECKSDVINIRYEGIDVGDLIYDSYLRFNSKHTVDIRDKKLLNEICYAIDLIKNIITYFNDNKVDVVVASHATYSSNGILCRVAVYYNVDTYIIDPDQPKFLYKKLSKNNYLQTCTPSMLSVDFDELEDKTTLFLKAKNLLDNRMKGDIDLGVCYMDKSAYSKGMSNQPIIPVINNMKKDVIIMLHDFFDSPHVYTSMVFEDFYEWVVFTLDNINYNKYNVFIKPHPNGLPENNMIIEELKLRYKNCTFISKETSNQLIMTHGFYLGLTVHGTVAHEFAYHKIQTITCGNSPVSGYNFVQEATSKSEYINMINNHVPIRIDENEILKFFYMQYMYSLDNCKLPTDLLTDFDDGFFGRQDNDNMYKYYIDKYISGEYSNINSSLDKLFF